MASKQKNKYPTQPQSVCDVIKKIKDSIRHQEIYVLVIDEVYDGDNEGGVKVEVVDSLERARSLYLDHAYANEKYFLESYQEHAIVNRDDSELYCECYNETEQYCKTHAIVYVKSFEL